MAEWHTIETFPENEEDYLACDERVSGGFYQVVWWNPDTERLHVPDAQISYAKAFFTHWARLPLTPADKSSVVSSKDQ